MLNERIFVGALWTALARPSALPEGRGHGASARVFERRGLVELPVISLREEQTTRTARWELGTSCPRVAPAQSVRRESRRKRVPWPIDSDHRFRRGAMSSSRNFDNKRLL